MIKILPSWKADSLEEATVLALQESGSDISPEVAAVFASVIDADERHAEAESKINTAVHGRYGRGARWHGRHWLIPLPEPGYDALPIPQLIFTVQGHLVAPIAVETAHNAYRATVVGPAVKTVKLALPIPFLEAILDDDLGRFELVGRDGKTTGWSIPGLRESLRLPSAFMTELSAVFRFKSVWSWLLAFGSAGEVVAPLVCGSLLGLQFHGVTEALPVGKQPFRREVVLDNLTRLFGSALAAEMYQRGAPHLKSTMTNDEATSFILKEEGRRYHGI